jgi:hypothetical protein
VHGHVRLVEPPFLVLGCPAQIDLENGKKIVFPPYCGAEWLELSSSKSSESMRVGTNCDSIKGVLWTQDSFDHLVIIVPNQGISVVGCIYVLYDPSTITMCVSNLVDQVYHVKKY